MEKRREAIVLAKTATAGTYDIYTAKEGKLDKPLVTGDASFNDVTKIRSFIAPKNAKKPFDLYFYVENVVGATKII